MALAFVAVLGVFAWLMISRRMTATLVLPLAALSIAVLALLPVALHDSPAVALGQLLTDVIDTGVSRLAGAIFAVLLGAVLAAQLRITGAAERLVRYAAEYAGEDRFRLGLTLLCIIALLFTTLGGLGAVIMVASLTLPLLLALGFDSKVAGGLFLLGLSLGGCFNPVNWQLYLSLLETEAWKVIPYACVLAGVFFLVACAFLAWHTSAGRAGWWRQLAPLLVFLLIATAAGMAVLRYPDIWTALKIVVAYLLLTALAVLAAALLARTALRVVRRHPLPAAHWLADPGNWLAGAAVTVPLLLLLYSAVNKNLHPTSEPLQIPILTALVAGIAFCALASWTGDGAGANRTMRALLEGVSQAGPAVVLLIGIGMLLQATSLAQVGASLTPWIARLPVHQPAGFVAVFFVLSPLALYRGPLNLYGMGSGIIGLLHGSPEAGIMPGSAVLAGSLVMVAFFAVGMLQGVCDPTNTHNVWIANACRVPTIELTRLTVPWVLVIVLLGLIAGAVMFSGDFALAGA